MPYCIGFEIMNLRKLVTAEATTARQALLVLDRVQTRDQELKFIRSPQEGEIGVEMLRTPGERRKRGARPFRGPK